MVSNLGREINEGIPYGGQAGYRGETKPRLVDDSVYRVQQYLLYLVNNPVLIADNIKESIILSVLPFINN